MERMTRDAHVYLKGGYEEDPAVRRAGPRAELLFIRGLSYLAKNGRTDLIPSTHLELMGKGLRDLLDACQRLVQVGLWERDEANGGYRVTNFYKFNPPEQAIGAIRAREAAKKRGQRRRSRLRTSVDKGLHDQEACPRGRPPTGAPPPKGAGGAPARTPASARAREVPDGDLQPSTSQDQIPDWRRERVAAKPPDLTALRRTLADASAKYRASARKPGGNK